MKIFRQDRIEITRGDWKLILGYLTAMAIWLSYRFSVEGYGLLEGTLDILHNAGKVLASFFALKWSIEYFFLSNRWWVPGFLCIVLSLIVIGSTSNILGGLTAGEPLASIISPIGPLIIGGLNSALFEVALLVGIVFSKKSYDQFINNKNLAIENRENSLKILRAQFSPHFLFNNLNTIDALIDDRPEVAKQYVGHLASLYRYLTDTVNEDVMLLTEELAFIRNYLFLIEVRYGEDYRFDIRVEQETENRFLPSGALQTAVENVVKHNATTGEPIVTTILIKEETVSISNDKGGQAARRTSGTGLQNLKTRYELLGATPLRIEDLPDRYTLFMPLLLAQPE
jgi:hypothetical protein